MSVLVFDIGGTNMRLGIGEGNTVSEIETTPTPADPQAAASSISEYLHKQISAPERIVGGVAGTIVDGTILRSPNLPEWNGVSFRDLLSEATGLPVSLHNDADLGGLGEAVYGAGKEYAHVGYLAIGTGVGGTLVHSKRIVPFADGIEPGKQILEYSTGMILEDFVSGAGIKKETGEDSEKAGRAFYTERTKVLAAGIYNTVRHWSPEVFVLNGALMNEETAFKVKEIQDELEKISKGTPMPVLVRGALGSEAGLYGALAVSEA